MLRNTCLRCMRFSSTTPRGDLPGLQESFLWVKSIIRDKPTYVLTHIFAVGDGEARAVVRREFYVSTGYNAEQSIAGFLPVAGGTVVLSMSHAFTDQVAGSGGFDQTGHRKPRHGEPDEGDLRQGPKADRAVSRRERAPPGPDRASRTDRSGVDRRASGQASDDSVDGPAGLRSLARPLTRAAVHPGVHNPRKIRSLSVTLLASSFPS